MSLHLSKKRERFASLRRKTAFGIVAGLVAAGTLGATAASAADPGPFDPSQATVFVGYDIPTTLATAVQSTDGFSLEVLAEAGTQGYNALGYNTGDNYLYAIGTGGAGNVLQIDATGAITPMGVPSGLETLNWDGAALDYNQGTFGLDSDAGTYYVRNVQQTGRFWAIDVETMSASYLPVSQPVPNVSDIVYRDGFLWGYDGQAAPAGAPNFYRIDVETGDVAVFDVSDLGLNRQPYGGQWLYGNGNIGLTGNDDGTVYQIAITDGSSDNPSFEVVLQANGVPTANNDAASIFGTPADLALTKTGDDTFVPGSPYTYTITVTNNGAGASSGSSVTDAVPAGLTGASTTTDGCSITGGVLNCAIGALGVGESVDIMLTGTAAADATEATLENTATVTGNEADPNPDNNSGTFAPAPVVPAEPELSLVKSADVDVATSAGEVITYTFEVTNTGNVDVEDVVVVEGDFSGAGELGPVVCAEDVDLAPTESAECTASYTVVAADLTGEQIMNTASASGVGPDGESVSSDPATAEVDTVEPVVPAEPELSLVKSADVDVATSAGEVITYTFEVTNTGNVDVEDVVVVEGDFSGAGELGPVVCAEDVDLAPTESAECTASYTVVAADLTGEPIMNTASASGVGPDGESVSSDPATAEVDTVEPAVPVVPMLPVTGAVVPVAFVAFAGAMIVVGLAFLIIRRRRA